MSKPVEFYFDYVSPYAYLADTQLPNSGLDIVYKPISILDVMTAVGNQPTPKCPAKLRHATADSARWAKRYGVPLASNVELWTALQAGTINLRFFARGALAAQALGHFAGFHAAMFDAFWAHPRSVATREACEAVLTAAGVPGTEVFALAAQPEMEAALDAANAAAVEAGVFGVPFFRVGEEIFFGGDRLDFVKESAMGGAK